MALLNNPPPLLSILLYVWYHGDMKKSSKSPKKQKNGGKKKYKVRNGKEYNQALVDRGSILFWINEEAIKNGEEQHKTGKRGKPRTFSNTAIETALTLAQVFNMPLRTTYDRRVCYTALKERHIPYVSIPPQHNAKIWQHGQHAGRTACAR